MQTENKIALAATTPKLLALAAKSATKPSGKATELPPAEAPPTPANPQPQTAKPVGAATVAPAVEARSEPAHVLQPIVPATAPAWSNEDESAFKAMLARRKAAGYQRRGRDVGAQMLRPGEITPNAGTVVATIVGLVADRGTVSRGDLLDAMAKTAFQQAKARPGDRAWSQGYLAGAIRDGFLALASEDSPSSKSQDASR